MVSGLGSRAEALLGASSGTEIVGIGGGGGVTFFGLASSSSGKLKVGIGGAGARGPSSSSGKKRAGTGGILEVWLEAVGGGVGIVTSPITGAADCGCPCAPYRVLFFRASVSVLPNPPLLLPSPPILSIPPVIAATFSLLPFPALGNGLRPSSFNASASASSSSDPDIGGDGNGTGFVVYLTLLC